MLTRQKILLRLIAASGGEISKLKLAKLGFLLRNEGRSEQLESFYEFVPYLYGPYSFTLNHELENLARDGCIKNPSSEKISLTAAGAKITKQSTDVRLLRDLELLSHNYGDLGETDLLDSVYAQHPWFTVNSARKGGRRARRSVAKTANYTVGYQSFQVDGLLNRLLEQGISIIFDTRQHPVSRRYGFHKSTLSQLCDKVGLSYEHVPELGVPSTWRQDLISQQDYERLFSRYETEILSQVKPMLNNIAERLAEAPSALMCLEANSKCCHRSTLAQHLSRINGLPIVEVLPNGKQL